MKKLILGLATMIGFISFSNAQNVASNNGTKKMAPSHAVVHSVKKQVPMNTPVVNSTTTTKKVIAAKPATTQPVVLKKDGTPDKRHKAAAHHRKNHLKKDGTPDMRYKKNKKS